MLKSLLPAAAALSLAALAGQAMTTAPAVPGQGAAGWYLLHEGPMAKLAYGLPDSDQVALMLTCSPGDRTAVVYGDVQPRKAGRHLRAVAADSDQMDANATVEQCGIDQMFHGPNLLPW